jgi:hypothetical protein
MGNCARLEKIEFSLSGNTSFTLSCGAWRGIARVAPQNGGTQLLNEGAKNNSTAAVLQKML